MRLTLLPNQRRPAVGRRPVPENRRAWLPQQARYCPVLEDGSRLGLLVYPPLEDREVLQVRRLREETLRFTLGVTAEDGQTHPRWVLDVSSAAGSGGLDAHDLRFVEPSSGLGEVDVEGELDAAAVNLNAPPGAVGLRGAHDFVTPEGWDTVYGGVQNEVQPPHVPVLTARIETDWYSQPTEFRYVLAPGQTLSVAGSTPVGQVWFVPREPIELVDGDAEARAAFEQRQREYWTERTAAERVTNFGTVYSHHYRGEQKIRRQARR
jgi:hypothetical protein